MTETRRIRDDIYVEGPPPRLLGSRCKETGELFYPAQVMNPNTHRAGTMEPAEIPGDGILTNFTIVRRGITGFASPYALGVIELKAGPTLTAQLEDWREEALRTGVDVELVIGVIRHDPDGVAVMGPKFRPCDGPVERQAR